MDKLKKVLLCNLVATQEYFLEDSDRSTDEDEDIAPVLNFKKGNFNKTKSVRISLYMENVIFQYNNQQFQSHFRVTRECFKIIVRLIGPMLRRQGPTGRKTVDVEKQLLSVLWLLATPDSFRSVGDRFNMAKSSLSVVFVRVIKALNTLSTSVIRWPTDVEVRLQIQRQFCLMAGVPFVLGAVDGTYIPIKAPVNDPEVYITRKCHYAITLQAICIPSLKFTDVFVGYPGSVSDTRIFKNSDIYRQIQQNKNSFLPNNTFILGDKAYPTLEWCIPPFVDRGNLSVNQKRFNQKHAQTRQVIERAFALLFGRFRRLKFLDMNTFSMIPHVVLSACVLHNICLDYLDLNEQYIADGENNIAGHDGYHEGHDVPEVEIEQGRVRRNLLFSEMFEI